MILIKKLSTSTTLKLLSKNVKKLTLNFIADYAAPISPVDMTREKLCLLSEKIVDEYNRTHPNEYDMKAINPHNLDINPALPEEIKALILALIDQYKDVLAEYTNTLPKCMKGVKPHEFKLKPNAKPIPASTKTTVWTG